MQVIISAIAEGLLWAFMAIGIYISFRILKRPDLTTEGSFPFGAAVASTLIVNGVHPIIATFLAFVAGALAGFITGYLMTKANIHGLLAGILVMTGLYSVNLVVMGRSNVSLLNTTRLTNLISEYIDLPPDFDTIIIGILLLILVISLLVFYFKSDSGQALIATGDNEKMARSMGINTDRMKILGLALANGLIGLSGGLISQYNGYADISMGIGIFVIGLAAIIIVEIFYKDLSLSARFISIPIGAIFYRFIVAFALYIGLPPELLNLVSAVILGIFLFLPKLTTQKGATQ
jgi:putative ABC transport system permease protein